MRRLAIVVAAAAACLLFTACPKPTDEPVTIPDGMYEETAHYFCTNTHRIGLRDERDTTVVRADTVYKANVMIVGGDFFYPDLCKDTFMGAFDIIFYRDYFVFKAEYYCSKNKIPARAKSDGFVYLDSVHLRHDLYLPDTSYKSLRVPIRMDGDRYVYEYIHNTTFPSIYSGKNRHELTHVLRRL